MSLDPAHSTPSARPRPLELVGAAAHAVVAIALVVVALGGASIVLPVSLSLPVGGLGVFAAVDLAAASAVVLLVSVAARAAAVVLSARGPDDPGVRARQLRAVRYLELSQVAGITLFLIAQLNGIIEAGTLVLCYAVASASVGVLWVQDRTAVAARAAAWPYSLGAAIAIVPWGVVALSQVVAIVTGSPPAPIVRVLTIVVLVLAGAMWLIERRWQLGSLTERNTEALHTVVTLANGLALLVLAVGLARPSALL